MSYELIFKEVKAFKEISNVLHANKKEYAPKYLGETFFKDTLVIKMEYINQDIEEAIQDPINPITVTQVMLMMFDAIQSLHEIVKYVHKDIKPDNFRIQDGCVKMIDFGLVSKYLDEEGNHII